MPLLAQGAERGGGLFLFGEHALERVALARQGVQPCVDRRQPRADIGTRRALVLDECLVFDGERGLFGVAGGQRERRRLRTHAHAGGSGVQQIHGLVRQLPAGQIAPRKTHGGAHGRIGDVYAVVSRIAVLQAAQHQARGVVVGLVDLDPLKAAFECGVALEVLVVFRPCRGGDRAQFAAGECGLEQVCRVGAAGGVARADQGMRLVDEEQDRHGRALDGFDHLLQALLEFAFHAGAGLQQPEVERQHADVADHRWHVAFGDLQREAFDERRLADAGLAHQDRIILATPREDVDHLADFDVTPEYGVDPAVARFLREVDRETLQGFRTGPGGGIGLGGRQG